MRIRQSKKKLPVLLSFALLISLAGCGNSGPEPEAVISRAIEASKEVETYRAEMTVIQTENGEATRSNALIEFVSPDRLHSIQVNEDETLESIIIGQKYYNFTTFDNKWQVRQWPGEVSSINLGAVMVGILDSLEGLKKIKDEDIDGSECFHYRGSVDMKAKAEEEKAILDPADPYYEERLQILDMYDKWQHDVEFWVDKETYLVRQLKQYQETVFVRDAGEDEEREEHQTITVTQRFYDFNAPITIEPPAAELVEGVNLIANSMSSIGGKDIQHQQIKYEITISNRGNETARDVRVFIDTPATNQGYQSMEAEPAQSPVSLASGEYATYSIVWEYDLSKSSKEELTGLMENNILRTVWVEGNGRQQEEILSGTR